MGYNDDIEISINNMNLLLDPPEEEPFRQYWYLKKCREKIKELSDRLGRPLSACSVCMGCQMNTEHEIIKAA